MNETFRLRRSYRNQGIAGLLLFTGVLVASLLAEKTPEERVLVTIWLANLACVSLLPLSLLLAYWRKSLTVNGGRIVQQRLIGKTELELSQIVGVEWSLAVLGGRIVLRFAAARIKVDLNNFEPRQSQELTRDVRRSVPESLQQGWNRFCYKVALRRRQDVDNLPLRDDQMLLTRRHWDRLLLPWALIFAVAAAIVVWRSHNKLALLAPLIVVVPWLIMRLSTPAKGNRVSRRSIPKMRWLALLATWGVVAINASVIDKALYPALDGPLHRPAVVFIIRAITFVFFGVVLFKLGRDEKQERRDDEANAASAAAEWERLEAERGESPDEGRA